MAHSLKNRNRRQSALLFATVLFILVLALTVTAAAGPAQKPRFSVSNLTVRDAVSGLVWSRSSNPAGQAVSWYDASRFISMLNRQNYGGHSDWRLPEIDELKKLVSAAVEIREKGPDRECTLVAALTRAGFDARAGDYWSSSTSIFNNSEAYYISMNSGNEDMGSKSLYMHVWPVRSGPRQKRQPVPMPSGASPHAPAPRKADRM